MGFRRVMSPVGAGSLVAALCSAVIAPNAMAEPMVPVPTAVSDLSSQHVTGVVTPVVDVSVSVASVDVSAGDAAARIAVTVPDGEDIAGLVGAIQNGRGAYSLNFTRDGARFVAEFTPSRSTPNGRWEVTYLHGRHADGSMFEPVYDDFASVTVTGSAPGHEGRLLRAATLIPMPEAETGIVQSYALKVELPSTIDVSEVSAYVLVDGVSQMIPLHSSGPSAEWWTTVVAGPDAMIDVPQVQYLPSVGQEWVWFTPAAELGHLLAILPN